MNLINLLKKNLHWVLAGGLIFSGGCTPSIYDALIVDPYSKPSTIIKSIETIEGKLTHGGKCCIKYMEPSTGKIFSEDFVIGPYTETSKAKFEVERRKDGTGYIMDFHDKNELRSKYFPLFKEEVEKKKAEIMRLAYEKDVAEFGKLSSNSALEIFIDKYCLVDAIWNMEIKTEMPVAYNWRLYDKVEGPFESPDFLATSGSSGEKWIRETPYSISNEIKNERFTPKEYGIEIPLNFQLEDGRVIELLNENPDKNYKGIGKIEDSIGIFRYNIFSANREAFLDFERRFNMATTREVLERAFKLASDNKTIDAMVINMNVSDPEFGYRTWSISGSGSFSSFFGLVGRASAGGSQGSFEISGGDKIDHVRRVGYDISYFKKN